MQVYRKILATIDCSPVDETIIEHITALALQNSAQVYLLHVVHSHTLDQERIMHKKAIAVLRTYCDNLRGQGIDAHIITRSGEPDDEILAEINGKDYDLVAMATHGHNLIGDILFGSVSSTLKHKISVPLLLIRGERR